MGLFSGAFRSFNLGPRVLLHRACEGAKGRHGEAREGAEGEDQDRLRDRSEEAGRKRESERASHEVGHATTNSQEDRVASGKRFVSRDWHQNDCHFRARIAQEN